MQSRRDQVQAHAYVMGRLTSALVRAEPDAQETPLRRTTVGVFAGAMIGALVVAGFAVFGLIFPNNGDSWREPGTLVVEEESGNRYVFLDGRLRPVFNFASARLLLGADMQVETVSRETLTDVARGQAVGIVGAPDLLPDQNDLRADDWLICAGSESDEAGRRRPSVTVQLGWAGQGKPLPDGGAVLARAPDGQLYLAWRAQRLRITRPWVADALGYAGAPVVEADAAWLNALPAGPDLAPVPVPRRGVAGPLLDGQGTRIGQVFVVSNAGIGDRFYLLRPDGLTALSKLEAALVLGDPAAAAAYPGGTVRQRALSAAALASAGANAGGDNPRTGGLPEDPPRVVSAPRDQLPCARFDAKDDAPRMDLVFAAPSLSASRIESGPGVARDERVAGRVAARPGSGVLAQVLAAPGAPGQAIYLISDTGIKFPLADADTAAELGYRAEDAVAVPTSLLALLPTGPALSKAAAGGEA